MSASAFAGPTNAWLTSQEVTETADALERDANLQQNNAAIARSAGAYNASRQQDKANTIFGAMRADVAGAGVAQDSGSVLEVLRQSHVSAELDRLNILHGSEMRAIDALNRSDSLRRQSGAVNGSRDARVFSTFFGATGNAVSKGSYDGGSASESNGPSGGSSGGAYSQYPSSGVD